jgi:hypothetical protein
VRAVAIKLLDVPGAKVLGPDATTQDFILANHPGFFVRDAIHFAALMTNPLFFALGLSPFGLRLREARNLLGTLFGKISNPLGCEYWSQTPYKFGDGAVKYMVRPTTEHLHTAPGSRPNQLRQAMIESLQDFDVTFDFLVQPQVDARRMPIEDATVIWDEKLSSFKKVATIRIPKQIFDTPERDAVGEHLSFDPWHALEDHRPLGGINRVRRVMYSVFSAERHKRNNVPEPKA